jgi:hypothetical protein
MLVAEHADGNSPGDQRLLIGSRYVSLSGFRTHSTVIDLRLGTGKERWICIEKANWRRQNCFSCVFKLAGFPSVDQSSVVLRAPNTVKGGLHLALMVLNSKAE